MIPTLIDWSERVVSSLGNGLVQGMLVAAVVWLVIRLPFRTNAATRYAVQFVALVIVVILPVLEYARAVGLGGGGEVWGGWVSKWVGVGERAVPGTELREPETTVEAAVHGWGGEPSGAWGEGVGVDADVSGRTEVMMADPEVGAPRMYETGLVREESGGWLGSVRDGWELELPGEMVLLMGVIWASVAMVRLAALVLQCVALRRRKAAGVPAPEAVRAIFGALVTSLPNRRRSVELRVVPGLASPMLVGYRRPAVLIPAELCGAEGVDWERMLRHELAHLCRWDDWTNLFQQFARAVLFFHPAVGWLSRRLTVDREIACDDHVLSATGSPRAYALFLTEFARRTRGPVWVAAPGAWSNPSQLEERITMLLDTRRNASPRLAPVRAGLWTAALLLVALFGLTVSPRLALAEAMVGEESVDETSPPKAKPEEGTVTVSAAIPVSVAVPVPTPVDPPAPGAMPVPTPTPTPTPALAPAPALAAPTAPAAPAEPGVVVDHAGRSVRARSSGSSSRTVLAPAGTGRSRVAVLADGRALAGSSGSAGGADVTVTLSGSDSGEAMERRLERLERLVSDLQKNAGRGAYLGIPKPPRERPSVGAEPFVYHSEDMSKVLDEANQAVAQATREAERAMRDAQRTARQALEAGHLQALEKGLAKEGEDHARLERETRRRDLQFQRQVLQKQIAALESQLGRLEGQLDRLGDSIEKQGEAEVGALAREQARMERQKVLQQRARTEVERRKAEAAGRGESRDVDPEKPKGENRKSKDPSVDAGSDREPKF